MYDIILEINDTRGKLEVLALHTTARELFTAVVWQASFCDDGVLVSPRKVSIIIIIIIICNFLIYLCIPNTSDVWWSGTKYWTLCGERIYILIVRNFRLRSCLI